MKICFALILLPFALSCKTDRNNKYRAEDSVAMDSSLIMELDSMARIDQIAAWVQTGEYEHLNAEQWAEFKDSVFKRNFVRAKEIFIEYGYPGYSLVGKKGESDFWVVVQHCDFAPEFQAQVLECLGAEVANNNASGPHYALLLDRVNINTGKEQVYGTQVAYNHFGQAYSRNLADSAEVDSLRISVGLDSLKNYLNFMTTQHFEMNRMYLQEKGIYKPLLR